MSNADHAPPREPTQAMIEAAYGASRRGVTYSESARDIWCAMWDAAPAPVASAAPPAEPIDALPPPMAIHGTGTTTAHHVGVEWLNGEPPAAAAPATDTEALVAALRNQQQLDEEGVIVGVSRQACDEAANRIEELNAEIERLRHTIRIRGEEFERMHNRAEAAEARVREQQAQIEAQARELAELRAERDQWRSDAMEGYKRHADAMASGEAAEKDAARLRIDALQEAERLCLGVTIRDRKLLPTVIRTRSLCIAAIRSVIDTIAQGPGAQR